MPLTYLGDENLPGRLLRAIQRHNARGLLLLDYLRTGEPEDLPLGSTDPAILQWIEQHRRVLLTVDEHTMPAHLAQHLQDGRHVPGIFMVQPSAKMADVLDFLVLAAYASDVSEWRDQIRYIP
jgi:hypothetical protein